MEKQGSKWDISPTGIKTLPANFLLLDANMWVYFVKMQLIPTTHDKTVSPDRVMAAYCIMQRIPLDVGHVIAAQIRTVFSKPSGQLFFPWLIMRLCVNAAIGSDIEFLNAKQMVTINGIVNNKTLR